MCIVIDINCLCNAFNQNAEKYDDFKPVSDWIIYGKGKLVYGGTKYKNELKGLKKYLRLLIQLKKAGKIVEVNGESVDQYQSELVEIIKNSDFDDPHLIAIIIVSGCKLICSLDKRAYRFIKNKKLYPTHCQRPKIYKGKSNKNLLTDENIATICHPTSKPNKILQGLLQAEIVK